MDSFPYTSLLGRSKTERRWPTAIDLFSGSGAASAALKRAHFRVLAAVDNDPVACATYRLNHPRVPIYETDIRNLAPSTLRNECLANTSLDLMIVCAPCQPFSNQNRNRKGDRRSRLLIEAARFVSELKPKVLFVENVPGLAADVNANLLTEFREACGPAYQFSQPLHVNAADYGVPQRRLRCLLMATKNGPVPSLPPPTTPPDKRRTVRDAIFNLRRLSSGEVDPDDPLHRARNHRLIALRRLQEIPQNGGSRKDLPKSLTLKCHRSANCYPDVYGRMRWDTVAPTLTTGCTDVTRGRFAHPEDDRALTPREAALLQTFPSDYAFAGSPQMVATQIGNAIPFELVRALAPTFREAIRQHG
ncbi:MAG: DNA cytosine methyltransferase [Bacteroidetes bacterium SB0662_bin_6]|nr:DNA cytosine methyltransferase [Bacteroidetes bacterium SB0668_bin_1]MYE03896.1 DNA cytosine methyltransferase [Bacteroidetes bacterium SB0662_bin_6]